MALNIWRKWANRKPCQKQAIDPISPQNQTEYICIIPPKYGFQKIFFYICSGNWGNFLDILKMFLQNDFHCCCFFNLFFINYHDVYILKYLIFIKIIYFLLFKWNIHNLSVSWMNVQIKHIYKFSIDFEDNYDPDLFLIGFWRVTHIWRCCQDQGSLTDKLFKANLVLVSNV